MKAAVYTGSRNLYTDMAVAVKSLLINSDADRVYLLIEDDDFPFELPDCVRTINVSRQEYFHPGGPNMRSGYTYLAMMRAALALVFPDLDTILSLDVDTIVNGDISDLWELPLGSEYYFAASQEKHRSYEGLFYTNMGVTLFNLRLLRETGKVREVIETLNRQRFTWVEQDVFNYLCQGRILDMPSAYNVNTWTAPAEEEKILHFAGIKEWQGFPAYQKYQAIPFSDIRRRRT